MRQGNSPKVACKKAIQRIITIKKEKAKDIQVAFIALNKKGEVGAFAIQKGFSYAIRNESTEKLIPAESFYS
jgi:N4-(beta-N-acetylglucosaminyl)-L-asparaginase